MNIRMFLPSGQNLIDVNQVSGEIFKSESNLLNIRVELSFENQELSIDWLRLRLSTKFASTDDLYFKSKHGNINRSIYFDRENIGNSEIFNTEQALLSKKSIENLKLMGVSIQACVSFDPNIGYEECIEKTWEVQ